jgi:GntR family transcriptional regulator
MTKEQFTLDVEVDRSSPVPLHAQIANPLAQLIESGQLAPGTRLEDEVSMAQRLRVSRPTARKALETLANRGLIVRRRGAGTEVTPRQVHRPMALTSLHEDLIKAGHTPRTSVLEWLEEPATPGIATALGLPEGSTVVHIRRLRMIEHRPLAILTNYMPPQIAPTREELSQKGFYDLLREKGVEISIGVQQIGARLATAEEARLLNEPPGAALLTMQRTAYDPQHRAIEFGMHVYRASQYTYSQTVFAN